MSVTVSSQHTVSKELQEKYEVVIGLEVHCQLLTNSKIFASDVNRFGADPNTNIGPISLALPGTLPKLNKNVVEYAVKIGLACQSEISRFFVFDRKNYFYPDLPKGYQISQDKIPVCIGGKVRVITGTGNHIKERDIRLHHIHLEEDAGKSVHDGSETQTLLDYNRAGTPLVEIVSEPDLRSAEETGAYVTEIRRLVRYLGISDGNMEEGSLRADVNISVRLRGAEAYGTKVEIKNMNSIRNIMRAVDYESNRQILALENQEPIYMETRMFDVDSGKTYSMRVKETMNDYRYFPDPDLCPVSLSEEWLKEVEEKMPLLPNALRDRFINEMQLPRYDAFVLTDTHETAEYFQRLCENVSNFKAASNWMMGVVKSYLNENGIEADQFPVKPEKLAALINMVEQDEISNTVATQKIFPLLIEDITASPKEIALSNNWLQNSNTDELESLVDEVLTTMTDKVDQFRKGKKGLMGLFVGEVMKKSGGAADPKLVNKLLAEKLNNKNA